MTIFPVPAHKNVISVDTNLFRVARTDRVRRCRHAHPCADASLVVYFIQTLLIATRIDFSSQITSPVLFEMAEIRMDRAKNHEWSFCATVCMYSVSRETAVFRITITSTL